MRRLGIPERRFSAEQAASLVAITEPWLSCDGCFEEIDRGVDVLADGAGRLDEPLRVHLARYPACFEEAETLLALAAQERHVREGPLLEQLRTIVDPPLIEPRRMPNALTRVLRRRRK